MLSNNHICKVQAQKFALLQEEYLKAEIMNSPCSLVMSLRDMFVKDSDLCYAFACEAYKLFANSGRCDADDFQLRYEQIATYGVLMSSIVWGYDVSKGTMNLYTTSIQLLSQLAQRSILVGKKQPIAIELEQLEKAMYKSDRIKNSIQQTGGKLIAARLDVQVVGRGMQMQVTLPRTAISLDTHVIIPFSGYQRCVDLLRKELQNSILRVTAGNKVRNITLNLSVLSSIYGEDRAKQLVSYVPDIYSQRFYVPSVGASKYTAGVTNIRPTEIDEIRPISLADIDLSEVSLDYSMVVDYFLTAVDKMTDRQLGNAAQAFGLICLNSPAFDLRERLKECADVMYPRDIWDLMKANDKIFKVENYKKLKNKYGSQFKGVSIPSTVKGLSSLLSQGVFKVLSTKRDGSFSTVICSNSMDKLEEIFGSAVWEMESEGVRLRRLQNMIERGATLEQCSKLIERYHLEYALNAQSFEELKRQIDIQLYNVEMSKTVVKQPKLVLVRNLEARDHYQYYKYLDLKAIVEIFQLS